jgi:hypothetical protein
MDPGAQRIDWMQKVGLNAGGWRLDMDEVRKFLEDVQKRDLAKGHFLGLLHILIGRRIARSDGTVISAGLTWRDLSILLKNARWEPDAAREIMADLESLPPRDRQRYWYTAIAQAQVGSDAAIRDGDKLATIFSKAGYVIGPSPRPQ